MNNQLRYLFYMKLNHWKADVYGSVLVVSFGPMPHMVRTVADKIEKAHQNLVIKS